MRFIGEVISTKRNELDNILRAMNIQIDNPISILNQDISRTFLVSSKAEEKYELFMKATLLDVIGNNYREAELICQEEYERLKHYNAVHFILSSYTLLCQHCITSCISINAYKNFTDFIRSKERDRTT